MRRSVMLLAHSKLKPPAPSKATHTTPDAKQIFEAFSKNEKIKAEFKDDHEKLARAIQILRDYGLLTIQNKDFILNFLRELIEKKVQLIFRQIDSVSEIYCILLKSNFNVEEANQFLIRYGQNFRYLSQTLACLFDRTHRLDKLSSSLNTKENINALSQLSDKNIFYISQILDNMTTRYKTITQAVLSNLIKNTEYELSCLYWLLRNYPPSYENFLLIAQNTQYAAGVYLTYEALAKNKLLNKLTQEVQNLIYKNAVTADILAQAIEQASKTRVLTDSDISFLVTQAQAARDFAGLMNLFDTLCANKEQEILANAGSIPLPPSPPQTPTSPQPLIKDKSFTTPTIQITPPLEQQIDDNSIQSTIPYEQPKFRLLLPALTPMGNESTSAITSDSSIMCPHAPQTPISPPTQPYTPPRNRKIALGLFILGIALICVSVVALGLTLGASSVLSVLGISTGIGIALGAMTGTVGILSLAGSGTALITGSNVSAKSVLSDIPSGNTVSSALAHPATATPILRGATVVVVDGATPPPAAAGKTSSATQYQVKNDMEFILKRR